MPHPSFLQTAQLLRNMRSHQALVPKTRQINWAILLLATSLVVGLVLCGQTPLKTTTAPSGRDSLAYALREHALQWYETEAFDSCFYYASASAERGEKTSDWRTWGEAQTYVLAAQFFLGQSAAAAASFPTLEQKALATIPTDSTFWSDYFNTGAAIYDRLGNYEAAIQLGLKEIAFYEKTNNRASLALAQNNVGAYYLSRGDYDRALDYTTAALQGYSSLPKAYSDLVWTYDNLAKIWYRKTEYLKSIAVAEKGLALIKSKCPEELGYEINLNIALGGAYSDLKAYEKSLFHLHRALYLQEANQLLENYSDNLKSIGYEYTEIGQLADANTYLQKALAATKPDRPGYGKLCRHMGRLQKAKGDLWTALEWKQKALKALSPSMTSDDLFENPKVAGVNEYYDFMHALVEKAEILQLLSKQASKAALKEQALMTLDLATVVLDSMHSIYQEGSKQFWNEEARPILENAIQLALELHQSTENPNYLAQAFGYSEKGKAYLLSESLLESEARKKAGIPATILEQEKLLKIDVSFYNRKVFEAQQRNDPDSAKILLWQTEILQRRRSLDALKAQIETNYPKYYQLKYKQETPGIPDIQRKLPANTGVLEYFWGDRATYAFYLDGQQAKMLRFEPDSILKRILRDVRNQDTVAVRGRGAAAIQAFATDGALLYQHLVAPVLKQIPENLVIIPSGPLAYLPFEILLTENNPGQQWSSFAALPYLVKKTTIRYEYSALLAFQPSVSRRASRFFDGYAPVFNPTVVSEAAQQEPRLCLEWKAANFANLPNNRQEVESLAVITGGNAIVGVTATEAYFRVHEQEPRILHLAMHGFLNDCDPAYSGLVFGSGTRQMSPDSLTEDNDGILHAYEINNLHLNAELAVLSACNTGQGKLAKGEGVISLARAFKYAGCPNVLMSLWQAEDAATSSIMQLFYKNLKQGMGKATAIRQAKLDYMASVPRNHPFFWGAFVLIGDDLPLQEHIIWHWYLGGFILLIGIAVVFLFLKNKSKGRKNM